MFNLVDKQSSAIIAFPFSQLYCGGLCGSLYSAYCGLSAVADAALSQTGGHTVAVLMIIMVARG